MLRPIDQITGVLLMAIAFAMPAGAGEPTNSVPAPTPAAAARSTESASQAASSGETSEQAPRFGIRPYLQIGGLTGFDLDLEEQLNEDLSPSAAGFEVDPGTGVTLRLGAAKSMFRVEAVLDAIPSFRWRYRGAEVGKISRVDIGGNLRLDLPVSERIRPNVIVGGGYGILKFRPEGGQNVRSLRGGIWRGGGGIDFYFRENAALALESTFVVTTGEIRNTDYVTLGWSLLVFF